MACLSLVMLALWASCWMGSDEWSFTHPKHGVKEESVVQVPTSLNLDDFAPLCDEELAWERGSVSTVTTENLSKGTKQMGMGVKIGDMRSTRYQESKTPGKASWSCGSERMWNLCPQRNLPYLPHTIWGYVGSKICQVMVHKHWSCPRLQ